MPERTTTTLAAPEAAIGIEAEARREIAAELNRLLADEFVLYAKTRNYHWNVTGPDFPGLHAMFEEQYEELDEVLDDVAERVRALGAWAEGSLAAFQELARLDEAPGADLPARTMVQDLMVGHEAVVRAIREAIPRCEEASDGGTVNLLEDVLGKHEKMAWMLAATHAEEER